MAHPPSTHQKRIESLLGRKPTAFEFVEGGYTPAARWRVHTLDGTRFAKIATTPLTAKILRREARHYEAISGDFMPRFFGWEDHPTAPLLIIEDLSDSFWPPPWTSKRVARVLSQIEKMHQLSPTALLPFDEVHQWEAGWRRVATNPEPFLSLGLVSARWLEEALPTLQATEEKCATRGHALTHCDLRSDNLCLTVEAVKFVDWGEACLGSAALDLGFFLPSLAAEQGPKPQDVMPGKPDVAAWVSGFFACRAGLPLIPDAPLVRTIQQIQLRQALPWAIAALGLPPAAC